MKKIELNRKKVIIALILIILIQSVVYFFVACNKNYIHIDEGYSYGLINYDKIEITDNKDFYNTWHSKDYYNDYLTISSNEAADWSPVYEQQKNDVHPPFYYFMLRIFDSFNTDNFSKWPGIVLNMFIHIGITVFTYLVADRLFKNKWYALGIALIGGLTTATLETIMLTRMYALTALNILIILYLHLINYEKEEIDIKSLSIMVPFIVLGSLTHYYYLVFLFVLYVMFMIKYLRKKQVKNAIKYTGCMAVSGIISLLIFPYSFAHMFMGYRGQGLLSNLTDIDNAWNGIHKFLKLTFINVSNGMFMVAIIVILGIFIYEYVKNKQITLKFENKETLFILIPTLVYFIIVAVGSPYTEIRYIMPIAPLLFMLGIYAFKNVLKRELKEDLINKILIIGAVILLLVPIVFKWNITYQYPEMKEFVDRIEEDHAKTTLFVFNKNANRFMDDIYLFTKIDESYIIDSNLVTEQEIRKVLINKNINDGMYLYINEDLENDDFINIVLKATGLTNCNYIKRLNACDVYYLF